MFSFLATAPVAAATAAAQAAVKAIATVAPAALPTAPTVELPPIMIAPKTPLALNHPWITHTFAGLFILSAILLIVLLAIQTTKQEGLSGTIGGRVESAYRTRLGLDKQIERFTTIIAVSFVLLGLLVSLSGI